METIYFKTLDSTQKYLKEQIKNKSITKNTAVYTFMQTDGIGSRDNSWVGEKDSLFFSFCMRLDDLVDDLPISSASLYFSYIFKSVLASNKSRVWLKWPNDFYVDKNKVGGCISNVVGEFLICGIGLNFSSSKFSNIDICIDKNELFKQYLRKIEKCKKLPKWEEIFSKYKIEFYSSKEFYTHINEQQISMKNAVLDSDGSLIIDNKKVYNTR